MRVLLIQPPLEDFYTTPIRLYPLGLLYVAGVFQRMGCQVRILDSLAPLKKKHLPLPADFSYLRSFLKNKPFFYKRFYRFGLSLEAILKTVQDDKPQMVGISAQFTAYYKSVAQLAVAIKNSLDVPVFVGGNHASVFGREIQSRTPQIDFVLKGPAENVVPGFISSAAVMSELEAGFLDWKAITPAHELLKYGHYKIGRKNYISLTASRGCPYHCEFCSVHGMFGRQIGYRRVDDVLDEMRWNFKHRDTRIFNFEDDNLTFNAAWFRCFLKAVVDDPVLKGIELTAMNGICYPTLDKELLLLMYRAGFRRINLAFVTQDTALQQKYRRPVHSRDFEKIVTAARRLGFFVTVYVIIGLPEQTFAEVKESIDYLVGLDVLVGPSVFYLPPGSTLYDKINAPSEIITNWNLYRSSAFAVETPFLNRADLVELFSYTRKKNLENRKSRR